MAQDKISQPAPGKPGAELETTPQIQITDVDTKNEKKDDAVTRRITIMRIIQSGLSSLLSLAIAVWQGKVYVTYQNTKSLQRAWPDTPNLVPTLLLFSVAIAAFVFDVCMLVAYVMPYGNKHARRAIAVGGAANYIVTSAKTVAYAISAVISRTSYNFGNATSQNSDLWSWTCTDQAATMDNMTQAETNCTLQKVSWYFALAQIVIEGFGWVISLMVWWEGRKKQNETVYEKLHSYSAGVDGQIAHLTPKFEVSV